MKRGLPLAYPGQRIGLFGGSFDPAHAGHAHVANTALKRMKLDRIWWLVTPQNPLKPQSAPLSERMRSARKVARGAKMIVTDLESRLGARFTYQTLRALKRLYPGVRFTFVMGADNLSNFRQWRHWREIARSVPFAVVSRPLAPRWVPAQKGADWTYLRARLHRENSSALRKAKTSPVADRKPG